MDENVEVYLESILKKVFYVLLKMGAKKEEAEDIIQDTAYRFIDLLDGISNDYMEAWLHRVAINLYYDNHKKKKVIDTYIKLAEKEELLDYFTPEQSLLQSELQRHIQYGLSKLSSKDAEILLLKYSAEFSLKDIAYLLETTDKSIKTQLARAKKRLRKILEEDKYFE